MIFGLVDVAVGLVLGVGLFGDLDVGQLFSVWLNWAVGLWYQRCIED